MNPGRNDLLRKALLNAGRPLPRRWRKRYARRVRGWLEARQIAAARAVVVSHAKSGRTWLATMLAAYERATGTPLGVVFSHDNYIRERTSRDTQPWHSDKRLIVLVREPGDVLVSFYHHAQHRMKPSKRWVNGYPESSLSLWEFSEHPRSGLGQLIAFMNRLAAETAGRSDVLRVRYEDLRRDPHAIFTGLIRFVAGTVDAAAVDAAIDYAAFENMQRRERSNADDPRASDRLRPRDVDNPQSFKVRSGRVGGYREVYTPEQIASIDARVRAELDPSFGYPLG